TRQPCAANMRSVPTIPTDCHQCVPIPPLPPSLQPCPQGSIREPCPANLTAVPTVPTDCHRCTPPLPPSLQPCPQGATRDPCPVNLMAVSTIPTDCHRCVAGPVPVAPGRVATQGQSQPSGETITRQVTCKIYKDGSYTKVEATCQSPQTDYDC